MKKLISIIISAVIIMGALYTYAFSAFGADFKTVSGTVNYSYAREVLVLVNKERAASGLKALTMTESLTQGAMLRAAETTVSFSHTRPNGEQCFTAFDWTSAAGENIAYGQKTPEQVMQGWMNSSGHRANILSSSYTTIGIGCFEYNGRLYWSQAFSGGKGDTYNPSGTKSATFDISLKSGVSSRLVSLSGETTAQVINSGTTLKTTAQQTQKTTVKQTTKVTSKQTTKAPTTKPSTSKASTTKKTESTTQKSIYDIINSILRKLFK